jgi:glycosyltransferase involved in cell wall biosynthesis
MIAMLGLPNVHLCGHVPDVAGIWSRNHLLVLPSRYEGLPLALIEAMWCGRPAVVTDVGGNAELLADNRTGFIARAATTESFEEALERAWQRCEEWREMGLAARAEVEAQIPADPIGLFCEKLEARVLRSRGGKQETTSMETNPGSGFVAQGPAGVERAVRSHER